MVSIDIRIDGQPVAQKDRALIGAISILHARGAGGHCEMHFSDMEQHFILPQEGHSLEVSLQPIGSTDFVSFSGEIEDVRSRGGPDGEALIVKARTVDALNDVLAPPATSQSTPIEVRKGVNALVWDLSSGAMRSGPADEVEIPLDAKHKDHIDEALAPAAGLSHGGTVTIMGDPTATVGATCAVTVRPGISGLYRIEAVEHRWTMLQGYETRLTLVSLTSPEG